MSESDQPRILNSLDARTLPQQFFLHQLYIDVAGSFANLLHERFLICNDDYRLC
jgi:hypothetical protein